MKYQFYRRGTRVYALTRATNKMNEITDDSPTRDIERSADFSISAGNSVVVKNRTGLKDFEVMRIFEECDPALMR